MHSRNRKSFVDEVAHMSDTEGANSSGPDRALFLDIAYRPPAVLPGLWTSEGPMDQIQINVPQLTRVERPLNGLLRLIIASVDLELGGVEYLLARYRGLFAVIDDGLADLFLVLVPFGGVLIKRDASERYSTDRCMGDARCGDSRPVTGMA